MASGKEKTRFPGYGKIGYLRNIMLVSLLITVALPAYEVFYIYPSFTRQLIEQTEDDAVRVARYLTNALLGGIDEITYEYETIRHFDEIRELLDQFGLMKVKLFSERGETVYSTDPRDIGTINKNSYFYQVVAAGSNFTKLVSQKQATAEGQRVEADVVETYVPVRRNGKFAGAFELYYDVTERKAALDQIYTRSVVVLAGLASVLLLTIMLVLNNLAKSIKRLRQAMAELEVSESRFRDISFSVADWIWEVDRNGRYIFSSGNVEQVIGYDMAEVIGKTPFDFMEEDEAARVRAEFEAKRKKKEPITGLKNWNRKKDGTRVCLLTNGVPVFGPEGDLAGYRGVDKDITADYLAEEKAAQYLKVTETIIENVPIGILIVGKDKRIKRINRIALEIIGLDDDRSLVGEICHKNICPAESGRCPVTDLGKSVDRSEKFVVHRDGRRVPILKTARAITLNNEDVVLEAFMDITKLKQAEKALKESERKYRTIMNTSADPVVVYDSNGLVTFLNPAFTRKFGWKFEELVGKRIDFVPEEAVSETRQAVERVLQGADVTGFETRRRTRNGRIIDVLIGAARIEDENGELAGMVVNFHDVTEQKRILAELERARTAAESASRTKSEFLANMSHEIRTPMNGIIGMTELTLDTHLTPEQREYLKMVKMSADSLLGLINDILDFSKIEAGRLELETIGFNLRNTLENAVDTLALKAHEKGLELACHIRPDVPTALIGDPGRLRQVIVNLAGNSIKFTETGEVVIRVELEAESENSVRLHFMAADTGIGIPEDKLSSVFESFEQVDGSTTRKYGGTGLGLSISRQLVELMGGEIWVESPNAFRLETHENRQEGTGAGTEKHIAGSSGPGSVFHFTAHFGLGRPEKMRQLKLARKDLSGMPVLVVDDNYTNRMLLREMLTTWGLVPTVAAHGEKAIALSERAFESGNPFRLVLLDMQMPEIDGFEAARRIKATPAGRELKIIMLSSVGQRGDSVLCRQAGISGYLSKPVKQSDLLDAIMMTMGLSGKSGPAVITRHTVQEARESLTVLLAEDNEINQTLATKLLESRGHRVIPAKNGKEAVDAFLEGDIDLILMDVQMPEMDGFEATSEIRKRDVCHLPANGQAGQRANRIPIVAMTAHAMKGDRERCLDAGMDDYVSKPIDPKELFDVIGRVTRESRKRKREKPPSPPGAGPMSSAVFDLSKAMGTVLGNRELFQEIAGMFLGEIPRYMERIREGIATGDAEALNRAAHSLKGAVGNFGADEVYEAAWRLEKLGKEGNMDGVAEDFLKLEEAIKTLGREMNTVLDDMKNEDARL